MPSADEGCHRRHPTWLLPSFFFAKGKDECDTNATQRKLDSKLQYGFLKDKSFYNNYHRFFLDIEKNVLTLSLAKLKK